MSLYQEDEPSLLEHDGHFYSVNKILCIAATVVVTTRPIASLDLAPYGVLDAARVQAANIVIPIVVLAGAPVILDGMHRAVHAQRLGYTLIQTRELTTAQLTTCLQ